MVNKVNSKASGTSCHQESSILSLFNPKDKEINAIPPPKGRGKHHHFGYFTNSCGLIQYGSLQYTDMLSITIDSKPKCKNFVEEKWRQVRGK